MKTLTARTKREAKQQLAQLQANPPESEVLEPRGLPEAELPAVAP
jgi:hypothetical protein